MPEKTFERRVYPISIDFAEWEREIPPLCGVNGCPLDTVGYQPNRSIPLDLRMDFEEFYSEIGVTSIRTHHDGFNTANIFGTKTKQHCCIYGLDTDFLTDSLILSSSIPRIPPFCNLDDETEQNANPQVILDYFVDLPEQPDRTNVWLFWRPYEDEIDDEDNYEYAKNGCRDAYQQMIENNYEICFRVGENNSGPTFINGPQNPVGSIGSAPDDSDAMMAYARVAKNIISHLSFPTEKTLLDYRPDFIELWNESESNKFTGPEYIAGDDRTPESAEAQALFILEFSLCIYQQVQHVGSRIGGFCFASESMKDFAETIETHSNEGHSLTEPRDYLAMSRMYWMLYYWFRFSSGNLWEPDYISFHWYGSILKEEDGTSGDEVNQTIGDWAADLERGCETLNDVADAFNQELPPIQITEWNYAVPRKAPKKCQRKTDLLNADDVWDSMVISSATIRTQSGLHKTAAKILEYEGLPDVPSLLLSQAITFDDILELRNRPETVEFRRWLWSDGRSDDYGKACDDYYGLLARQARVDPGHQIAKKAVRISTLSVVGGLSGAAIAGPVGGAVGLAVGTAVGAGISLIDGLLLDRFLEGDNPRRLATDLLRPRATLTND